MMAENAAVLCRRAWSGDVGEVSRLLRAAALPTEGVDETLMPGTSVLVRDGAIVGCASVEVHGHTGLLRSVVVSPEMRGRQRGRALVRGRIEWAREQGLENLVLFTETAAGFFERLGFRPVPREELPPVVRGCFEYGFCPTTSTSMRLDLRPGRTS